MSKVDATAEGARLYRAGRFPEAAHAYRQALAADPNDPEALAGAGTVALLHNRLDEAATWLECALARSPNDPRALQGLAEAAYRQDDFAAATRWWRRLAALLDDAQRRQIDPIAAKLAAFRGAAPYRTEGAPRDIRVPFEVTDPLPVLNVTLNDRVTVPFFIDTGGHEVYVDEAIAHDLGVPTYGSTEAPFAGGKTATIGHGRLATLTLGGHDVHDLPITILDLAGAGAEVGGVKVKGVIGTAFLYHHLATIGCPGGALVLRPRTPEALRSFEQQAARQGHQVVPFWLSGTHFILAWGTVNRVPMLLFVDTGGSGIAFTGPLSTIERAGITLQHDKAYVDHGGGGPVRVVPFLVDTLTLGDVARRNLKGIYLPEAPDFPPDSVHDFGVGGIISHQFFRPYELTFDFVGMRLFIGTPR